MDFEFAEDVLWGRANEVSEDRQAVVDCDTLLCGVVDLALLWREHHVTAHSGALGYESNDGICCDLAKRKTVQSQQFACIVDVETRSLGRFYLSDGDVVPGVSGPGNIPLPHHRSVVDIVNRVGVGPPSLGSLRDSV